MFIINEDKSIYITRGDFAAFTFRIDEDDSGEAYIFQTGDVVRFKVFEKKGCDAVVLQKDFPIIEECDSVEIRLMGSDTKIGGIIHKPEDYWYEVELNPDTYPQTIIGYDEDGAKTFRLLPEGKDLEPDEDEEQQGTSVYERVLALVGTMSEHGRQAAEDSQAATAAAAAAEQSAADAAAVARSVRADADSGMFTPQVGENGNWWIGGEDTGIPASNANVGNMIETTRTDLGDSWVLCNGDAVPEGAYAELRDVLLYDTEGRRVIPVGAYTYKRALPKPGQWFFVKSWNAREDVTVAYLYDANTDTWTTIACPAVTTSYKKAIIGLTWDGERYILAVSEDSASSSYTGNVYLFTSTDLGAWTQKYKFAVSSIAAIAYDISFDGTNILFVERDSDGGTSIYAINKGMTTKTLLVSGSSSTYDLVLLPEGYWTYTLDSSNGISVYASGSKTALFSFSSSYYLPRIAFFSDRYWIGMPKEELKAVRMYAADLTTNTTSYLDASTMLYANGYDGSAAYFDGAEYNPNAREWTIYLRDVGASSGTAYYAANISEDANPTDATRYRIDQISKLPETLSREQMTPDRSVFRTVSSNEIYLRCPSVKRLPMHDSDSYKYIYAGDAGNEYIELEYIESSGTQYIDTGFEPTAEDMRIVCDVVYTETPTGTCLYGAQTTSSTFSITLGADGDSPTFFVGSSLRLLTQPMSVNTRYVLSAHAKNGTLTVDLNGAISTTSYSGTLEKTLSLLLFGNNNNGKVMNCASAKVYSCQIYDNGTLVRDYVPCRTWDGRVCLYDRVSGEYALNNGAGKFIAGAEVGVLEEV